MTAAGILVVLLAAQVGAGHYDVRKEAALGERLAAEVRQRTTELDSPLVRQYVERLGARLAGFMPEARLPFTFSLITDDPCPATHEPLALPGGYMFVPAGLFLAAGDEAEFAAVLAHAMEHVALRHGLRPADPKAVVDYSRVPLVWMGGWAGNCGSAGSVPRAFAEAQRRYELEADAAAVSALARYRAASAKPSMAFEDARREVRRLMEPRPTTPPSLLKK